MEYKIKALSIHEFGQRKDKDGNPHQEDWIYPATGHVDDATDRLFILCDGMGGHAAGEVASEAVCEAMSGTVNGALAKGEEFTEDLLRRAIADAYDLLDRRDTGEEEHRKMGTTMTCLMLHGRGYTIAHIGDSRVYHIRPKTGRKDDILFQTEDHSLVNDLLKMGELTPEEAETFPRRNVITRAMQPNLEYRHKADIHSGTDIRPGDYFYMCSDGMLEQTSNDNLCFMLNDDVSDEEKRGMLVRVTRNNKDNHSAHLIHILDVQPPCAATPADDADDGDLVQPEFGEAGKPAALAATGGKEEGKPAGTRPAATENSGGGSRPTRRPRRTEKSKSVAAIIILALIILALCASLFSWLSEKRNAQSRQPDKPEEVVVEPANPGSHRLASPLRSSRPSNPQQTQQQATPKTGSSATPAQAAPQTGDNNPEIHVVTSVHIVQPEPDELNIAPVDPEYVIIDEPMHGAPVDSGNILAVEPPVYGGPLVDDAWIDTIDEAGVEPTGTGDVLDC
ncbi:MAG: serine/threonine-protein phosphatase [Bacteroidaceae bacterium]|nr:serine/threonine-protein phosphatase [Bacteroidaceae bacterium]